MVTAAELQQMTSALGETMTASMAGIATAIGTRLDAMDADIYANRSAINAGAAERSVLQGQVADLQVQVEAQQISHARFALAAAGVAVFAAVSGFLAGWAVFG